LATRRESRESESDPMKKPKIRKPPKRKASCLRHRKAAKFHFERPGEHDEGMLAMLEQAMQREMDLDPEIFHESDPVDLFAEFLAQCKQDEIDDYKKTKFWKNSPPR